MARDVSPAEAAAVRGMLRAAWRPARTRRAGEGPEEESCCATSWPAASIPDYEQALRLGLFRPQPSERSRPVQLARAVLGAVFLSDAQIDAVYGPPRNRLGYLGRRLARPFDLLWRLGSYGARWARLRRRAAYTPPP